ncbi:MAG TPA: copper resistance protein CopC [Candidatus Polarisedimenticolia bacterium]|nr:copper resistance protein CopC [Candidatus Polarisedimenticolia bacterium]
MRRFLAPAILLCASLLLPAAALGHAELVSADPADGTSVQEPFSGPITLTFSEALAEGSKAELSADTGAFGQEVGPDPADPTRIIFTSFDEALPSDFYTIEWTSVADDGDILRGTIHFAVVVSEPPTDAPTLTPEASPSEAPTAAPSPSAEPTPAPSAQPSDGADGSAAIIPIIVGLALVGAAAWWLVVRRRPSAP